MEKDLFLSDFNEETNTVSISLCGEIDHHSAVTIRREIDNMLLHTRPKNLIIELSSVDFMDSSGLGLIMGRFSLMQKLGGTTILRNPNERIKKILSLAGMERIIKIERIKEKNEKN